MCLIPRQKVHCPLHKVPTYEILLLKFTRFFYARDLVSIKEILYLHCSHDRIVPCCRKFRLLPKSRFFLENLKPQNENLHSQFARYFSPEVIEPIQVRYLRLKNFSLRLSYAEYLPKHKQSHLTLSIEYGNLHKPLTRLSFLDS